MVYVFVAIWCPVLLFLVSFFLVLLICLKRRRRGVVLRTYTTTTGSPVVVTSTTHTAPGGYPVAQMPPATGYQQQAMYPPYPTQATAHGQMPMPMPAATSPAPGVQAYVAPYPPMPTATMNPPSYEAAVAGVGVGQPNNASSGYEKQAPYNPNYNAY
ncbi:protein shisa-5 isoform X3 [Anastrepha ludens]|uniref:protein shisa-5 isoform X3 n=1 Tax=Anastrepha ludens TaxID=28586 RepID=UPI0023AF9EC1|nr:protein shisa-5 isoform X3 [Anastrepha ludens]